MDSARQALAQAEQLSPNNPHIFELEALWAHEDEDTASVQDALKKMQHIFPNAPETQRIVSRLASHETTSDVDISEARNLARSGETSAAAAAYRKLFPNGPQESFLRLSVPILIRNLHITKPKSILIFSTKQ